VGRDEGSKGVKAMKGIRIRYLSGLWLFKSWQASGRLQRVTFSFFRVGQTSPLSCDPRDRPTRDWPSGSLLSPYVAPSSNYSSGPLLRGPAILISSLLSRPVSTSINTQTCISGFVGWDVYDVGIKLTSEGVAYIRGPWEILLINSLLEKGHDIPAVCPTLPT